LVATEFFHHGDQARSVHWERSQTNSVVCLPGGAHPSSCDPQYGFDVTAFKAYAAAIGEGNFADYRQQVIGADEATYQQAVGGLEKIQSLSLPVY